MKRVFIFVSRLQCGGSRCSVIESNTLATELTHLQGCTGCAHLGQAPWRHLEALKLSQSPATALQCPHVQAGSTPPVA